jgi:hypothetical protein
MSDISRVAAWREECTSLSLPLLHCRFFADSSQLVNEYSLGDLACFSTHHHSHPPQHVHIIST